MVDIELKGMQFKIKGQFKPFLDENLQMQIPGEESDSTSGSYLYPHFDAFQSPGDYPFFIDQEEAKDADEAWQKYALK